MCVAIGPLRGAHVYVQDEKRTEAKTSPFDFPRVVALVAFPSQRDSQGLQTSKSWSLYDKHIARSKPSSPKGAANTQSLGRFPGLLPLAAPRYFSWVRHASCNTIENAQKPSQTKVCVYVRECDTLISSNGSILKLCQTLNPSTVGHRHPVENPNKTLKHLRSWSGGVSSSFPPGGVAKGAPVWTKSASNTTNLGLAF